MNKTPTPKPCVKHSKSKRISIYNPWKAKMVSVAPYSNNAKKLYRYYIKELGYDPRWVAPPDLKFYEDSGVFRRVKVPDEPKVSSRIAYKNYLSCHNIHNINKVKGYKGFELLNKFRPVINSSLTEHGGLKVYPAARCVMEKKLEGKVIAEIDDFYISSGLVGITNSSQIDQALKDMITGMIQKVPEKETQGSGWSFVRVSTLEIHLGRYKPLKGSSYIELPAKLKAKKAIINVKNTDEQCFKWAVLSALYPVSKNGDRLSNYIQHEDKLDWTGLTFPVTLQQIPMFERRNRISINVYGWDEKQVTGHLFQKSIYGAQSQASIANRAKYSDEEWDILGCETKASKVWQNLDLLLLDNDDSTKSHYCWIKKFSSFARQPSDHKHCAKHYCHYCLHGFPSKEKLESHLGNGCREITEARPVLPEPGSPESFVHFKSFEKQYKAPFVIYADFEALTRPVSKTDRDPSKSYTDAYQTHEPCGYCIHIVSSDPDRTFDPIVYRGENTIESFVFQMKGLEDELKGQIQAVEPMVMTTQDTHDFNTATKCCLCNGCLGKDKVRDHDHLTGKYRGAAHSKCNIEEGKKRTKHFNIPVFFHNLTGYDSHLIVSEVGKHTSKLYS